MVCNLGTQVCVRIQAPDYLQISIYAPSGAREAVIYVWNEGHVGPRGQGIRQLESAIYNFYMGTIGFIAEA